MRNKIDEYDKLKLLKAIEIINEVYDYNYDEPPMSNYRDINFYLNKAKENIIDAIRCSKTMESKMKDYDDYKMLINDLNYITEIINKCDNTIDKITDTFEELIK